MEIIVSQISEVDGLDIRYTYPDGIPQFRNEEYRVLTGTSLNLHAARKGREVRFIGTLRCKVKVECARCLTPVHVGIDESVDLFYSPPVDSVVLREESELSGDDLQVAFYEGDLINLDDLVREQVELALPMTTLCKVECKGLCQKCGGNLNDGSCLCSAGNGDDRWAVLKNLKP